MGEETAPSPRRVHIVGGPGSGKTTPARSPAATLALPAHDLDAGPKRLLDRRLADARRIAASAA